MQFYGRAEETANNLIEAFKAGRVPKALSYVFIQHSGERHADAWSWSNQLHCALAGYSDAMGYKQWREHDRFVKKGQKGFCILAPVTAKGERINLKTGEKESYRYPVGFRSQVVFGFEQTDGEGEYDPAGTREFVESLPLLEVARRWGLNVGTLDSTHPKAYAGYYQPGLGIALGVENLATWAHEMIHAADDKLHGLVEKLATDRQEKWRSEVVAELGGAVLLHLIGKHEQADDGGCWDYVRRYAKAFDVEPIKACQQTIDRVCRCVAFILDESRKAQKESGVAA